MFTFDHGLEYTSSLNPVNITIEIYSMPKLYSPIFRTPIRGDTLLELMVTKEGRVFHALCHKDKS